jgi:hypothetical protein
MPQTVCLQNAKRRFILQHDAKSFRRSALFSSHFAYFFGWSRNRASRLTIKLWESPREMAGFAEKRSADIGVETAPSTSNDK